jgi:endogenous inhibitor of DNA gyrase (YacG/DUF329 family)
MKDTEFTVRLKRHCPTCGIAIQIEGSFNNVDNCVDSAQFVGHRILEMTKRLDNSCPSKCPKCSKKKEWDGVITVWLGP